MNFPSRLLAIGATLLLGACAALSGKHASFTVYSPQLQMTSNSAEVASQWQLLVDTPQASNSIDSARIAVMPEPGVLEVYPNARWRDPAPAMLRSLTVAAFDQDGRVRGVSAIDAGLNGDYSLAIDLRDFQVEIVDGSARAAIRLSAKLFDRRSNRIVASQSFDQISPAAGSDMGSAFAAFEQALNELLPRIVDWTIEQGNASDAATDSKSMSEPANAQ